VLNLFSSARHPSWTHPALCAALSLGGVSLFGCAEDEPPNLPSFVEGEAVMLCTQEGSAYYLSELSFVVEDKDGAETLLAPSVELSALSLPVESELLPAGEDEGCGVESCRVRYTWRFDASENGRVACGADEGALSALLTISDENGHRETLRLSSQVE